MPQPPATARETGWADPARAVADPRIELRIAALLGVPPQRAIATKWLRERPYREEAAVKRQAGADVGHPTPQTHDA
jgi:hypothetical protein